MNENFYADDTLVIALDDARAQGYMTRIAQARANYGLLFNWRKLNVLPIGCDAFMSKILTVNSFSVKNRFHVWAHSWPPTVQRGLRLTVAWVSRVQIFLR